MKPKFKKDKGFTLVELMIVIAVIGILAAIAIPNFLSYRKKAKEAQALYDMEAIKKGVMALALDTGMWPSGGNAQASPGMGGGVEAADLSAPGAGLMSTDGSFPGWEGPYLQAIPKDPWGRDYHFDEDYNLNGQAVVALVSGGANGSGINVYDDDNIVLVVVF
jgi:type II secretion system protein G